MLIFADGVAGATVGKDGTVGTVGFGAAAGVGDTAGERDVADADTAGGATPGTD